MIRLAGAGVIAALALGLFAPAQDRIPQFKSESELVVLHVLVTDRSGGYISGLTLDDFRLFDETRPQTPKFFLNEDAPVTVGLVIDSSGSMGHVRDRVIAAAAEFVESSNPEDEVFALVFNDNVQKALGGQFTSDPRVLRSALVNAFQPVGRTALYDAVVEGLEYATKGSRDRRVLVVLSDGGDNASRATLKDVVTKVQSSNTVIYSVALEDPYDADANPGKLRQLSDASGGESFSPKDVLEVRKDFQKIARDVRHMYTIGFEPMNTAYHAGFHRLRVDVKTADGRRLSVHSRTGYLKAHVGP